MTEAINPSTEKVEAQPQAASATDAQTPNPAPAQDEEFDKDRAMQTIRNLREIEKKAKADARELEQLRAEKQQRAEAEMTEAQRLQKQAEELRAQNAKLQSDLLRREVIAEVNLPSIFADRLRGTTKEEMLEDAKQLLTALPQQTTKTAPRIDATNPANAQQTETDAQRRERLFGSQGDIFNMGAISKSGGGVVWTKKPE